MFMTAEQIKKARLAAGISQRRLAFLVGVHPNSLSRFELGKMNSYRIQVKATELFSSAEKLNIRGLTC